MFKNVKRLFLFAVLAFVGFLAFACEEVPQIEGPNAENCKEFCAECGPEANSENCKDFCPEAPVCNPEANAENCKPFFPTCPEINDETCEEFFPFVAPTDFILIPEIVKAGGTVEIIVEDFEPVADNVFTGLAWTSDNEEIATVDQNGVVSGVRPGLVNITATSLLDSEVSYTTEITVTDVYDDAFEVVKREKAAFLSVIPVYADANFDFPVAWNTEVEIVVTNDAAQEVKSFEYPTDLAADKVINYTATFKYGEATDTQAIKIWAVKNATDNVINRLNKAVEAVETLIADYTSGKELVVEDLILPTLVYGTELTWSSNLSSILNSKGEVDRRNDNTPVTLGLVAKCADNSASKEYRVNVKGYSTEEKIAYILEEGSLAQVAGKEVSTSIVLPDFDSKFKAKLSYTSSKPEVMDNSGKLVAPVTEKTEVKFTVNVDYSFAKTYGFKQDVEFTVTVVPQTEASKAADAWLQSSEFKAVAYKPYGNSSSNVLDVPTTYTVGETTYDVIWDVTPSVVAPKYLQGEEKDEDKLTNAFELTAEGKPELVVQFLRYTQVPLKVTFKNGADSATIALVLSIGASNNAEAIYTGTWENADQADGSLNQRTGLWDTVVNGSHFDKVVGHVKRSLGYGYWSGVKMSTVYNGADYEYFNLDYMYWEVKEVDGVVVKDSKALFNNGGDMGGNWGWLMKNTTDQPIYVEVGTYAASGQTYADGATEVATLGSRVSWSMDGYALGFVCDKDGNVTIGSKQGKLQNSLAADSIIVLGSDDAKCARLVGDSKTKGAKVHYVEVPAGGYAMSWKYQFYGVGSPVAVYPFTEATKVEIEVFDVHPLNSTLATNSTTRLTNAETAIAKGGIENNATIENNLLEARSLYENELSGLTKEKVYDITRLEAAEKAYALLLDAEIAAVLAKENQVLPEGELPFVTQLGALYTRLNKLNDSIVKHLTQKAAFDAKYSELAAIDLTVTLDYKGGYAKGLYGAEDFPIVIPQLLGDIYDWMLEQGAFTKVVDAEGNLVDAPEGTVAPTKEEFDAAYFANNYAKYATTLLTYYLFTPKYESDGVTVNENYHDIIPGTTKFFNSEKYHDKWIDMMDYVDEYTRAGNMSGQDAWGRKGEISAPSKYTSAELVIYQGKEVTITNSGALLGAYRFSQYVSEGAGNAAYKSKIPADIYAAIFDRQTTQERYSRIVYHCTDATVELPKAAHKDGAEFAGWFFEDGTPAVITGAYFKDVTVYAKWNPVFESKVAELVGKEVSGVYYGDSTNGYRATTELGDINMQVSRVGLGEYAIVVGDKMFALPKYSYIDLGKGVTEDKTLSTKEEVQVYGTDGYAQFSTGLLYDEATGTVKAQNSYGHGALYGNSSKSNITISEVKNTYGRNLGGADFGYNRYLFSYDAEKAAYVGTLVSCADGTSVTLKPGDFFWCPMTGERFCTGLTDCNGKSGVPGVLSEGVEVQIINVSTFLPVDKPWIGVQFFDGNEIIDEQYFEGTATVVKPADLKKSGHLFLGWAEKADATEADVVEVELNPTTHKKYYAVFKEVTSYDAVVLDASYEGDDPQTFTSLSNAIEATNAGGTITVKTGTYAGDIELTKAVKFVGPNNKNYGTKLDAETAATFTGKITVQAGVKGVEFYGINFAPATKEAIVLEEGAGDLTVAYSVFGGTTRGIFSDKAVSNITLKYNLFNAPLKADARLVFFAGTLTDALFEGNTFVAVKGAATTNKDVYLDAIRCNNIAGKVEVIANNFDQFYGDNFTVFLGSATNNCTEVNILANSFKGANDDADNFYLSGVAVRKSVAETQINIKYNEFNNVKGTFISLSTGSGKATIEGNAFLDSVWTTFLAKADTLTATVVKNFFGATPATEGAENLADYAAFTAKKLEEYGATDIKEVYEELIKDLYAYLSEGKEGFETYETFKAGFDTNWANGNKYGTNDDALYAINSKDVVDDTLGKFVHSTKFAPKWMAFFNSFDKDVVTDVNAAQSMWASPYTGLMRIRNYFGKGTNQTAVRNEALLNAFNG